MVGMELWCCQRAGRWPTGEEQGAIHTPPSVILDPRPLLCGSLQLEVFVACEGVKHRVVHGHNPPRKVWSVADMEGDCSASPGRLGDPSFLGALGGRGSSRGAIKQPPQDDRPLDERLNEVVGITAAMQELDSQLNTWLQSLKAT